MEKMSAEMLGQVQIINPEPFERAPDCVMETLFQKLNEIDTQIKYHEEMLRLLNA